jgi:hypothetical protein
MSKIKALGWGCGSVVEYLPSMYKALDLIPSTTKNKQQIIEAIYVLFCFVSTCRKF